MELDVAREATIPDALEMVIDRCLGVLESRPAGLLTDIDGTISLIAPTPDSATVSDEAKRALASLSHSLETVGAITGRTAENAEFMIAIPHLIYIGNHGLELRRAGQTVVNPRAIHALDKVAQALAFVERAAEHNGLVDGILYENKGVTGSIHYRLSPDQEATRARLLPIVIEAALSTDLRVSEGRMVIELRPPIAINKGTALKHVVEADGLRGVVFLGDDVTDIDAFRAVVELRENGEIRGLNVAVTAPESLPAVAASADVTVPGVASCVVLLTEIAQRLTKGSTDDACTDSSGT
jgi:trehalose 6-phosphate phosphatase